MSTRESNAVAKPGDREMVITRVFDAPRELVFDAWTDPEQIVHWWGPTGFTTTIEKMDVRPGGEWIHVMHGPDGTDYPNKSAFIEVVRPELLSSTHGGHGREGSTEVNAKKIVTFEKVEGNKTLLTLRMVFPSTEARDTIIREYGAIEGGKQTLARLAEHLASKEVAA
jgi:uncharacterized protein YndB with AHSA1/START domain